jgi:hypothetical protein
MEMLARGRGTVIEMEVLDRGRGTVIAIRLLSVLGCISGTRTIALPVNDTAIKANIIFFIIAYIPYSRAI